MKRLMSWIPALFALATAALLLLYPLTDKKMAEIESDLDQRRGQEKEVKNQKEKMGEHIETDHKLA